MKYKIKDDMEVYTDDRGTEHHRPLIEGMVLMSNGPWGMSFKELSGPISQDNQLFFLCKFCKEVNDHSENCEHPHATGYNPFTETIILDRIKERLKNATT